MGDWITKAGYLCTHVCDWCCGRGMGLLGYWGSKGRNPVMGYKDAGSPANFVRKARPKLGLLLVGRIECRGAGWCGAVLRMGASIA